MEMKNSLSLPEDEVLRRLDAGDPFTVRLLVQPGNTVTFWDEVREDVSFQSDELDDKILMKADGLPTYHMANVIDDHLMEITHVIRGEEWLSSTAHHVLLYDAFGWKSTMPKFAHLPLILKPSGKGKLSKRDGAKFNMPVFPLGWKTEEEAFDGFKEVGFDPDALINFLAFLGWNPGTEQEIFSLDELNEAFTVDRIGSSGARFDFEKALWYNQQYIISKSNVEILPFVSEVMRRNNIETEEKELLQLIDLLKKRVHVFPDFYKQGYYFYEPIKEFDEKTIRKKWSENSDGYLNDLQNLIKSNQPVTRDEYENIVKTYISESGIGFGAILPIIRVALSGSVSGPDVFGMMSLLGSDKVLSRLQNARESFPSIGN
jgi:glutamyl-tRNA synthetase